MSHLLSPVATSLDHSGKVCLSSVHSNASVTPKYACVWRFQLKAETALEVTGRKATWTQEYHSRRSRMLHVAHKPWSAHLRRQPKRGGCFSLTDLVVVQHMCLSGFDRLDTLIQKPVYSFNSFRCSWNRASQSSVFNVKDKQGLGPNLCIGICYSLDV
jgi:hypothetical protein